MASLASICAIRRRTKWSSPRIGQRTICQRAPAIWWPRQSVRPAFGQPSTTIWYWTQRSTRNWPIRFRYAAARASNWTARSWSWTRIMWSWARTMGRSLWQIAKAFFWIWSGYRWCRSAAASKSTRNSTRSVCACQKVAFSVSQCRRRVRSKMCAATQVWRPTHAFKGAANEASNAYQFMAFKIYLDGLTNPTNNRSPLSRPPLRMGSNGAWTAARVQ